MDVALLKSRPAKLSIAGLTYTPLKALGRGAYGLVWLYTSMAETLGQRSFVAAKIFNPGPRSRKAAEREAYVLRIVEHPHVVPLVALLYDQQCGGEPRDVLCLAYCQEGSPSGDLFWESLAMAMLEAAFGLGHIHSCGFTHNDVAPKNILESGSGIIQVSDCGSALFVDEGALEHPPGMSSATQSCDCSHTFSSATPLQVR